MIDTCTKCGLSKPVDQFVRSKQTKSGYVRHCKTCERLRAVHRRRKDPESARASQLKSKYGITQDVYDLIALGQGLVCRICGLKETGRALAVDHSHKTGVVRGLLCQACNTAIGLLREDVRVLKSAIEYLAKDSPVCDDK